jgi:hypothetical protein
VSDQPASLAAALILLQSRLPRITKDETATVTPRDGRSYTYSYANLASIHDAIFPLLAECNLAWITKPTIRDDGQFVLRYMLRHGPTGEYEDGDYPLPASGTPQQIGSAITYARRYTLTAVLGIAPAEDDDDGAAASTEADATRGADWRPPADPTTRKATRERQTSTEDNEWNTPPETTPGSILPGQVTAIGMLCRRIGLHADDARHAAIATHLGIGELKSVKDLSSVQAGLVIREFQSIAGAEKRGA